MGRGSAAMIRTIERVFLSASAIAGVSNKFTQNISHRRVERRQLEGLDEHCRLHPLKEKLDSRIVRVAGNANFYTSNQKPLLGHFTIDCRATFDQNYRRFRQLASPFVFLSK